MSYHPVGAFSLTSSSMYGNISYKPPITPTTTKVTTTTPTQRETVVIARRGTAEPTGEPRVRRPGTVVQDHRAGREGTFVIAEDGTTAVQVKDRNAALECIRAKAPSHLMAQCAAMRDAGMDMDEIQKQLAAPPVEEGMIPPTGLAAAPWLLYGAIGGGALLLVALLRKRKKR